LTLERAPTVRATHGALRDIPYMGVIYVVAEAAKLGYRAEDPDWCNLGQGQPEVGPLPSAPERPSSIAIAPVLIEMDGHERPLRDLRLEDA
jgi:hypothetical protein